MDIMPRIYWTYNPVDLNSVVVMIFKFTLYNFGYFFAMKLKQFGNTFQLNFYPSTLFAEKYLILPKTLTLDCCQDSIVFEFIKMHRVLLKPRKQNNPSVLNIKNSNRKVATPKWE